LPPASHPGRRFVSTPAMPARFARSSSLLRVVAAVALLAFAPSGGYAQNRLPNSAGIDDYLAGVVRDTRIPGIVALAVDADRIVYAGAFGRQDVARSVPMANDTIFRIASMTKPVTSTAVMMLVQEGDLGLDDPVSDYLPAFEDEQVIENFNPADKSYTTRPAVSPMTVRHLLTHTSGLGYAFSNHTLAALAGTEPPGASVTRFPLLHDPGTRWTYGESTRVLGTLVEEVSGQPLDEFLSERLFVPLGMSDTFYRVPAQKIGRVVTVHRTTAEGLVEAPNGSEVTAPVYGDGGLHSTAGDYAKFIQLFLNDGRAPNGVRLLSEATVALMGENHIGAVLVEEQPAALPALTEPFPLGAGRDKFGLGFQITGPHRDPFARSPGSMSWAGIFNTEFWIDPARGVGGVLLMQYLPFYDAAAIRALQGFEHRVYEGLAD
jgi:CubicO group peptidase (beta-lactamase class C family)